MSSIAADFPILSTRVHGQRLVYLDTAATAQKPKVVLEAIDNFYRTANANVHRGVHELSERSTSVWEDNRAAIAHFFGAQPEELIITRNTTEAINGVAYGWADHHVESGDVMVTTLMEHHSNFVPWQQVASRRQARLEVVGVTEDGRLDLDDLLSKLSGGRVKLVAVTHVSNTLGTLNPIEQIVQMVHKQAPTARILIDAAQSAPHLPINFVEMDVDFLAFSGHKLYGPMGVGGLLVRKSLLESNELQPWLFGGGMIGEVVLEQTSFNESIADRFTAGTPDVASTVGLATACEYISKVGWSAIQRRDRELIEYALDQLRSIQQISIIGPTELTDTFDRVGSVAFLYEGAHAHDVAQVLDSVGVAVRSGHHCTMPLHTHFGWSATVRVSFGVYSAKEDVDQLMAGLAKVKEIFHV